MQYTRLLGALLLLGVATLGVFGQTSLYSGLTFDNVTVTVTTDGVYRSIVGCNFINGASLHIIQHDMTERFLVSSCTFTSPAPIAIRVTRSTSSDASNLGSPFPRVNINFCTFTDTQIAVYTQESLGVKVQNSNLHSSSAVITGTANHFYSNTEVGVLAVSGMAIEIYGSSFLDNVIVSPNSQFSNNILVSTCEFLDDAKLYMGASAFYVHLTNMPTLPWSRLVTPVGLACLQRAQAWMSMARFLWLNGDYWMTQPWCQTNYYMSENCTCLPCPSGTTALGDECIANATLPDVNSMIPATMDAVWLTSFNGTTSAFALQQTVAGLQSDVDSLNAQVSTLAPETDITLLNDSISDLRGQLSEYTRVVDTTAMNNTLNDLRDQMSLHALASDVVLLNSSIAGFATIPSEFAAINTSFLALQHQIDSLNQTALIELAVQFEALDTNDVIAQLTLTNNAVDAVETRVDTLEAGATATSGTLTAVQTRATWLESQANGTAAALSAVDTRVTTLETTVGIVANVVDSQGAQITALDMQYGTATDALGVRIDGLALDVSTNRTAVNTQIGALSARVSTLETNATDASGAFATLQTQLDTLGGQLTAAASDIDTLQTQAATLTASLSTTNTELDTLGTQVTITASDLDIAEAQIATLSTRLTAANTTLLSRVDTLDASTATLQAHAAAVDATLAATEPRIDALETSAANVNATAHDIAQQHTSVVAANLTSLASIVDTFVTELRLDVETRVASVSSRVDTLHTETLPAITTNIGMLSTHIDSLRNESLPQLASNLTALTVRVDTIDTESLPAIEGDLATLSAQVGSIDVETVASEFSALLTATETHLVDLRADVSALEAQVSNATTTSVEPSGDMTFATSVGISISSGVAALAVIGSMLVIALRAVSV